MLARCKWLWLVVPESDEQRGFAATLTSTLNPNPILTLNLL